MAKKYTHKAGGERTPAPGDLAGYADVTVRDIITQFTPQGKKIRKQHTQRGMNRRRAFMDSFKKKEGLKTAYKKSERVRKTITGTTKEANKYYKKELDQPERRGTLGRALDKLFKKKK